MLGEEEYSTCPNSPDKYPSSSSTSTTYANPEKKKKNKNSTSNKSSSSSSSSNNNNNNNKKQRRFSDEQIKSLESIFESETRLEPRKKVQLAKELGLQPRQVAIWFQNKRARWKSKQLERDYSILRANYNNLASKLEFLQEEKQALASQLQRLNEMMMEKPRTDSNSSEEESASGIKDKKDVEWKAKPRIGGIMWEEAEEAKLMSMVEAGDGSLTSHEEWGSLDSDGILFHRSTSDYQWWDFWA